MQWTELVVVFSVSGTFGRCVAGRVCVCEAGRQQNSRMYLFSFQTLLLHTALENVPSECLWQKKHVLIKERSL